MAESARSLYVFLRGDLVGSAVRSLRGAVHFVYRDGYPLSATPVSLSLPVGQRSRLDISSWVDGLLPDNPRTRSRWMQELGAASTSPFDLLSTQAGLECAGAVQFHPEPVLPDPKLETLTKLADSEISVMLRLIGQDAEGVPSAGLGELRLSLPGAQPKMALRLTDDEWCLPTGSLATTHILKPQRGHLNPALRDSIAVNEYLCQTAAETLGLEAARTSLAVFGDEPCLIAERFDRHEDEGGVRRSHFEDVCQALGFPPGLKYQSDGGPAPEAIIGLLRQETDRGDPRRFLLSAFYNWLIGNIDGHSKNYGVLLDGSVPRLAPLYDLSSAVPYAPSDVQTLQLAMRFEEPSPTTLQQWEQTAARLRIVVGDELEAIAGALPDAFELAAAQCPEWASGTAQHVCERAVDHARTAVRGTAAKPRRSDPCVEASSATESHKVFSVADVGALVREARLAAGITQQQLADMVDTTRQWVIRLEQGHHSTSISTVLTALSVIGLEMVAQYELSPRANI